MSTRLAVVAGLVSGALAATALLVALMTVAPLPETAVATPSLPPASALASPSPASPSPTDGPDGGTATSSGDPSASEPPGSGEPAASAGPAGSPPASPGEDTFHVGQAAPPLDVPQVGGGRIDLAALRGQPVWVNFMATWCPSCIDEFPLMNGFAARYADEGLVIVAVDVREEEGLVAAFAERLGATFPIGLDADGAAQDAWAAHILPVHFWVDAEGIVREGALGGLGPDVMAQGVQAILPGVEVTP